MEWRFWQGFEAPSALRVGILLAVLALLAVTWAELNWFDAMLVAHLGNGGEKATAEFHFVFSILPPPDQVDQKHADDLNRWREKRKWPPTSF